MSKTTTVCRACLVDNLTMYRVTNSPYEKIYEKLSNAKLSKGNLPETFCYICMNMLKKFNKFAELTQESNVLLEQWYKNEIDCKPKKHQEFKISTTTVEYITSNITYPEPNKEVKIKIEPDDAERLNQVQYVEFINESDPYAAPEEVADVNIDDSQVKDDDSFTDAYPKPGTPSDDEFEVPIVKLESRKRVKTEKTPKGTAVRTKKTPNTKEAKRVLKQSRLTGKIPRNSCDLNDSDRPNNHLPKGQHKDTANAKKATKLGESYECVTCNRKFANRQVLGKHAAVHSNRKPFACDQCDYKCRKGSNLKTHKMTHTGEKPFLCFICGNKYTRKSVLKAHIDTAHKGADTQASNEAEVKNDSVTITKKGLDTIVQPIKPVENRYSCDVCCFKCSYKYQMKFHELNHTNKWPFSCDMCNYRNTSRNLVKQHLKNHYDEKEFRCSICDYSTLRKFSLEIHVRRIHFGEKPLSCDKCDYKCIEKGHLKRHCMAVHSNEKPFLCHVCDFTCSTKDGLSTHLKVHNGDKKYKCSICGYKCLRKSSLTTHVRTHTGEKPYACTVCDRRFAQKSALNTHVRRHSQK